MTIELQVQITDKYHVIITHLNQLTTSNAQKLSSYACPVCAVMFPAHSCAVATVDDMIVYRSIR